MILALLALARAGPAEDALTPVARSLWEEGAALEARERYREAATRYRTVRTVDPTFEPATLAIARVLVLAGDRDAAEAELRTSPTAEAVAELGRLRLEDGDHTEAAALFRTLVALRPDWPGAHLQVARAILPTHVVGARDEVLDYLAFTASDPVADGLGELAPRIARELRSTGRLEDASVLLDRVLDRAPELADALAAERVRIEVEQEAHALASAGDEPLVAPHGETLRRARTAFAGGDADAARRLLEVLVVEQPRSAAAWAALADVREAQDDLGGAEQAARTAMQLDPRSADHPAKVGDLLSRAFGGRFDAEAALAYARATRRRPDDPSLWARRAEAERRAGRWAASRASWERVAALAPPGPLADAARRAIAGADRGREDPPDTARAHRPTDVPEDAWLAFLRAAAWRERPEPEAPEEALTELAYVASQAPGFAPAAMLEAELRVDRGELDTAAALYERVLAAHPGDAEARARLASLVERRGDPVRAELLWEQAADSGDAGALLRRAERRAATWRFWTAREPLAAFFERVSTGDAFDRAVALEDRVRTRVRAGLAGVGALAMALPALPFAIRFRRRSGVDLDAVADAIPARWRELARLVSAIDHEVVKHHFGIVDAVADAVDAEEPDAARFAADRWFGPSGAIARLDGYAAELEALARSAGLKLNLRWRDARFRPLLAAVERLRTLEPALRAGDPERLRALRGLAPALGLDAHRALGALVDRLCVLDLDAELLAGIHAQAAAEFPDRAVPRPRVVIDAPVRVRMFRTELEDVLVNLVRNAIEATPAGGDLALGLTVAIEDDPVTFLERAVIRVCDHAPGKLTTKVLRSRYVARGLGLAVDLTSRAGGSIRVEEAAGYEKAVAVRVPAVPEVG